MTRRWMSAAGASLLLVAARAEPQPVPLAADRAMIRVQKGGNELVVTRVAPVAYSTLEQMAESIGASAATHRAAVHIVRASPPQEIHYLLCVTSGGTLVVGERVHDRVPGERRVVFARGAIVRSYPSLSVPEGWLWLVDVLLGRESIVTLQLRALGHWPVESVSVTMTDVP